MSEHIISTVEEFKTYLRENLSENRYRHTIGVAETTQMVLSHYGCEHYVKTWNGYTAGEFCGLAHDIAREKGNAALLAYCDSKGFSLTVAERMSPVLVHGLVSADMARTLCGEYPQSWYRAISVHTTGAAGMDELSLSLFIADFIEPGRKFLSDDERSRYLSESSLVHCAYAILCDMMDHWKKKGYFDATENSVALKEELEKRIRSGE